MDGLVELARKMPMDEAFHNIFTEELGKNKKLASSSIDKVLNEMLLNPLQHGIAYAELLNYKLTSSSSTSTASATTSSAASSEAMKNPGDFIEQARALMLQIPATDVFWSSKSLTNISRQFVKALLTADRPMRGVGPLKALVEKITTVDSAVLTSIHADLLLLVIKSHSYDLIASLEFLRPSSSLLSINPANWPIETVDFLQFWFYLGICYATVKRFADSQEAFTMALSTPSQGAVSAVQVESYKKLILVSLLATGEAPTLNHRLIAASVFRHLEALSAPYLELSKSYRKASSASSAASHASAVSELTHLIDGNGEVFLKDKNVGLIKQIVKSLVKKQISKLTQTYITFSLTDLATQVNLGLGTPHTGAASSQSPSQPQLTPAQLAERYVFDMICQNEVFAQLNIHASMVRFLEDPQEYDTTPFIDSMDAKLQEILRLSARLTEVERDIQLTPGYLLKSGMVGGTRGEKGGAGGDMDVALAKALSASLHETHGSGPRHNEEDEDMKRAMEESLYQH